MQSHAWVSVKWGKVLYATSLVLKRTHAAEIPVCEHAQYHVEWSGAAADAVVVEDNCNVLKNCYAWEMRRKRSKFRVYIKSNHKLITFSFILITNTVITIQAVQIMKGIRHREKDNREERTY